ncbi:hypothetical protein ACWC09_26160 [Streptomyces sp. NPDC001617]
MSRTVPSIATESPGNYETAALWNAQVGGVMQWMLGSGANGLPRFSGYQVTTQALTDNTWTSLTIDTEDFDSDGGHSTTTNTSRYTCQVAGTYLVTGIAAFAAGTVGNRAARLALNGTSVRGSFVKMGSATATHSSAISTTRHVVMAVGDYVELQGLQTSGASLNTNSATDVACSLSLQWVSA